MRNIKIINWSLLHVLSGGRSSDKNAKLRHDFEVTICRTHCWITYDRFGQISQLSPELVHGEKAYEQNDKEPDKFHANRARERSSGERQPGPPGPRERSAAEWRYARHSPCRAHHKTQQYRIQKDIPIQCQQSYIYNVKDISINHNFCFIDCCIIRIL